MKLTDEQEERLIAANGALKCFAADTEIVNRSSGLAVRWQQSGRSIERRWQLQRGSDTYPIWHRNWGHGGTATTALSNLIRWIRGQPVVPLTTWRYWSTKTVYLMREKGDECCELLAAAGWPAVASCVLCGRVVERFDWWHLGKVSGPCCHYRSGCRQRPVELEAVTP